MRRNTMSLAGALMLTACFGAPQGEAPLAADANPAPVELAPSAPIAPPVAAPATPTTPPVVPPASGPTTPPAADPVAEPGGDPAAPPATNPEVEDDFGDDDDDFGDDDTDSDDDAAADEVTRKAAARFLIDAAFGVTPEDMSAVERLGYAGWIDAQMAMPTQSLVARMKQLDSPHFSVNTDFFWEGAIEGEDQLRQRVAFALSEIVVVSLKGTAVQAKGPAYAAYLDILREEAFGNYEDLIRRVAVSPTMGMYLSHIANRPANPELGTAPDENFARELMQLFTIGLEELTPGGEPTGRPAYSQADVAGLAKVFTGFNWADGDFRYVHANARTMYEPMQGYADYHDQSDKTFLGTTLPGGLAPEQSVDRALDHILRHANVAPFVSKQLIQRLVTSNPTPAYVQRVGAAYEAGRFEADGVVFGEGRRGDMAAVTAAILLDTEAREPDARPDQFGRVRPPLARFAHFARTFRDDGGATSNGAPANTGGMRYMADYGQHAMGPPSVFGYTRPGYVAPGTWTGDQALKAPQMSLSSGAAMVGYINTMGTFVMDRGERPRQAFFTPDYASVLPLANDPAALTEELDLLLAAGTLGDGTKARIVEAVSLVVPYGESADLPGLDPETARQRIEVAVLMTVTAPAYGVQR